MKKKNTKKDKTKTFVKTQAITKAILSQYYGKVAVKLNKMHKRKIKPSEKQIMKQFEKITEEYAQMMEFHLGKLEMLKLDFKLPKGWSGIKD